MAAQLDAARLRASLAGKNEPLTAFTPPGRRAIRLDPNALSVPTYISQTAEQCEDCGDRSASGPKATERATIEASIEELEAIIPPLQERVRPAIMSSVAASSGTPIDFNSLRPISSIESHCSQLAGCGSVETWGVRFETFPDMDVGFHFCGITGLIAVGDRKKVGNEHV
jgi:hypothetical protein